MANEIFLNIPVKTSIPVDISTLRNFGELGKKTTLFQGRHFLFVHKNADNSLRVSIEKLNCIKIFFRSLGCYEESHLNYIFENLNKMKASIAINPVAIQGKEQSIFHLFRTLILAPPILPPKVPSIPLPLSPPSSLSQEWSDPSILCFNPIKTREAIEKYDGSSPLGRIKQRGMQRLATKFENFVKIKGEGHCLFRAISTGMLCRYVSLTEREKGEFLRKLDEIRADFGKTIPEDQWKKIKDSVIDCDSREKAILCMNFPETSNTWVAVMRKLAVVKIASDPVLKEAVEVDDVEGYLQKMGDPESHEYGGNLEAGAIVRLFTIQIDTHVLNLLADSEFSLSSEFLNPDPKNIHLVFEQDSDGSNGHYNLALP